ncbi:hypothetical protein VTG60DRAFT_5737 [Thermothelomyces hinnuleus]
MPDTTSVDPGAAGGDKASPEYLTGPHPPRWFGPELSWLRPMLPYCGYQMTGVRSGLWDLRGHRHEASVKQSVTRTDAALSHIQCSRHSNNFETWGGRHVGRDAVSQEMVREHEGWKVIEEKYARLRSVFPGAPSSYPSCLFHRNTRGEMLSPV